MNTERLRESFLNTSYIVHAPGNSIRLRIGVHAPALDPLLDSYGAVAWAFITGWNPNGEAASDEANLKRNTELRERLCAMGFEPLDGEGAGDDGSWPPERSFWVPGITAAAALELGGEFGQAAIVVGERGAAPELRWCGGSAPA